ncbi:hypothetical protein MXMO3_02732 [Maritalea myrionectae]|uniref:Uncharacterized protein n=1 Tax=Maritalea myrionectae TaxID=454601 RepID=A0A2R4MH11_9HYPH|nr:hypothetical protein MXMO3_02732 [Maritalea myrionectae]
MTRNYQGVCWVILFYPALGIDAGIFANRANLFSLN